LVYRVIKIGIVSLDQLFTSQRETVTPLFLRLLKDVSNRVQTFCCKQKISNK
jgi:hypothetical protein